MLDFIKGAGIKDRVPLDMLDMVESIMLEEVSTDVSTTHKNMSNLLLSLEENFWDDGPKPCPSHPHHARNILWNDLKSFA